MSHASFPARRPCPAAIVRRYRETPGSDPAAAGDIQGSGFFIAPDQMVTNWHVVQALFAANTTRHRCGWIVSGEGTIDRFEIDDVRRDEERDLAVIRTRTCVPDGEVWLPSEDRAVVEQVCQISGYLGQSGAQFHFRASPATDPPLKYARLDPARIDAPCDVLWVDVNSIQTPSGRNSILNAFLIATNGDAGPGASGSPLFDANSGRVLGIHTYGRTAPSFAERARGFWHAPWTVAVGIEHAIALL